MNILDLREKYADRLTPFTEVLNQSQVIGVHDYSFAVQVSYYEILKYLNDPSIFASFDFGWCYLRRGRWVGFATSLEGYEIFQTLTGKKTLNVITDKRPKYMGLSDETCYNLNEVLVPENFRHTELRRKVLRQAFTVLEPRFSRQDMREEGVFDIASDMTREWAEVKMQNPHLHRLSFPSARYRLVWNRLLQAEQLFGPLDIYSHLYLIDGQPFGFKIGVIENGTYLLLSAVTKFWQQDATKQSTWVNTLFFDQLKKDRPDVHTANFGLAFDKGLRRWKSQWPHFYNNHYQLSMKE